MAHFHIKKKKGRPYLYVREIARVNGKPKVISQTYIGPPEKVASLATGQGMDIKELKAEAFGALWLANQIDQDINLCAIIDAVIPEAPREKGPSVGEYFLYCVWNRMIETVSKNNLSDWYKRTAVQHIRPVDLNELTSKRFWEKWNRVDEDALKQITYNFFQRMWQVESPDADCLLFDTTNYYTFMASHTESEIACRGKNKDGRHHLRQIGLGLLVARGSKLPLYYSAYPGNLHDSKHFEAVMDEMFGVVCGLNKTKERQTVVIDKGMNSEGNYTWIDGHARVHFITTYSTYFAQELATIPLDRFEIAETAANKDLPMEECQLAYRTKGVYWGKERTVIVTYSPRTARKKLYTFESKLETIRQELLKMRSRVKEGAPHWKNPDNIKERYLRLCQRLHISSGLFTLEFKQSSGGMIMSFRKDPYQVRQKQLMFGKNIIITDNVDWRTKDIIEASLDRWQIEDRFRLSKNDDLVGVRPIRHWTDSKIRCHLFTCVVAMTYLRRIELKLKAAGINRTAEDVINDMKHLHSILNLQKGARKPTRRLETPSKTQAEVLSAFGHRVDDSGVLQTIN
jgi:transposase